MSNLIKKIASEKQASTVADPKSVITMRNRVGNTYEAITVVAKRSNQISSHIKEELHGKLEEFSVNNDNLEEITENREQVEISKFYEKLPHPTLMATDEFMDDKIYYRNPTKEAAKTN